MQGMGASISFPAIASLPLTAGWPSTCAPHGAYKLSWCLLCSYHSVGRSLGWELYDSSFDLSWKGGIEKVIATTILLLILSSMGSAYPAARGQMLAVFASW